MQSSHPIETEKNMNIVEEDLVEEDKDIFYLVFSFDPFELSSRKTGVLGIYFTITMLGTLI